LKIAHLTDLHTTGLGYRERHLLKLLDQEQPDLIVITGDTLSGSKAYRRERELLPKLHAPLGVWLVRGNWENSYPRAEERKFYSELNVHLLLNQGVSVRDDVWLMGLDDSMSGHPDLAAALQNAPPGAFKIALFHSPAYFNVSAGRYDLALAGHSHGGQVRFPFIFPFWVPPGVGHYVEGWFHKDGSRMYVSRGIGTTYLPIRFLCRPELAIVTIEHETKPVVK
jgi:predicted MPP superfamily phosphohydrolase